QLIARSTDLFPDRIRFLGEITDFEELRRVYGTALASVSPGYVGLSLTQSLWFGVPAIIARDEPHSPEIEAARKDFNSLFIESDSVDALSDALVRVENDRDAWLARRPEIARDCATRYSVESMIDPIVKLVEALRP